MAFASGAVALSVKKGAALHRAAGNVFFVSMLTMAALGAYLAWLLPSRGTVIGGVFTLYLVATAWRTARHKQTRAGLFDWLALTLAVLCAGGDGFFGLQALPAGRLDGVPAAPYFIFSALAAFAAAMDLKTMLFGAPGVQRIARHVWRMCTALVITTGSFFANGLLRLLPAHVHPWPLLIAALLTPLVLMIFWLARVYFTPQFKEA